MRTLLRALLILGVLIAGTILILREWSEPNDHTTAQKIEPVNELMTQQLETTPSSRSNSTEPKGNRTSAPTTQYQVATVRYSAVGDAGENHIEIAIPTGAFVLAEYDMDHGGLSVVCEATIDTTSLTTELATLDITKIGNHERPTYESAYDAAWEARIELETISGTFTSQGFDQGMPPHALKTIEAAILAARDVAC